MRTNCQEEFLHGYRVPGELATMQPLVSDKSRDSGTSSDSCLQLLGKSGLGAGSRGTYTNFGTTLEPLQTVDFGIG